MGPVHRTSTILADYYQFYIQDDDVKFGDLSDAWTPEAVSRLLAVAPHTVGIGTVRNTKVAVSVADTGSQLRSSKRVI